MNELRKEQLIENFRDKEYREPYAEDFLNTSIATQIRVLREQRGMTQLELAEAVGTKQTAISRIENINNTARNIGLLERIAFTLDCRLKVTFETYGSLVEESLAFNRENLQRPDFAGDPVFSSVYQMSPQPVGNAGYLSSLVVNLSEPYNAFTTPVIGYVPALNAAYIAATHWMPDAPLDQYQRSLESAAALMRRMTQPKEPTTIQGGNEKTQTSGYGLAA